jgi:hypothetical protein
VVSKWHFTAEISQASARSETNKISLNDEQKSELFTVKARETGADKGKLATDDLMEHKRLPDQRKRSVKTAAIIFSGNILASVAKTRKWIHE